MRKLYFITMCALFFANQATAQIKRYVKPSGTGDGSSWANASSSLQTMINTSAANDEVWVAAGTYLPTQKIDASGGVRDVSFILKTGVKIYGGLADGATDLTSRNFNVNASILSGNLGVGGKAHHVVVSKGSSNNVVLDGFTIQDGQGDLTTVLTGIARNQGAAINITNEQTNVVFRNLIIKNNTTAGTGNGGGAVFLSLQAASECILEKVTFDTNESVSASGGGISFSALGTAKLVIKDSKVFSCRATGGAGIYSFGSAGNIAQLEVLNSIFSLNHGTNTSSTAGAIYVAAFSEATIVNSTFYNNISAFGAVSFYNNGSTASINIYNSIFNGNRKSNSNADPADVKVKNLANLSLRYNLLQQDYVGYSGVATNYLTTNPSPSNLFLSTTITDATFLNLVEGAATEKGSNNYAANYGLTTDLAGEVRLKHDQVDLGAYEFQGTLPVELESFTVKKVNSGVQLNWKVATENNNDKFLIERSSDLVDFQKISDMLSKGDTQNGAVYNYTDYSPLKGNNYYRLSQVDKDGAAKILRTEVVKFDLSALEAFVYPNPAKAFIKLSKNNFEGPIGVKLVSLTGQTLLSKRFDTANEVLLDVRNVNAGNYILLLKNGDKIITVKTIITR